jgi:hypothetical protein
VTALGNDVSAVHPKARFVIEPYLDPDFH